METVGRVGEGGQIRKVEQNLENLALGVCNHSLLHKCLGDWDITPVGLA